MVETLRNIVDRELKVYLHEKDANEVSYMGSQIHSVYSRMEAFRNLVQQRNALRAQDVAKITLVGLEILRLHCKEEDQNCVGEIADQILPLIGVLKDNKVALHICLLLCSKQYTHFEQNVRTKAMEAAEEYARNVPVYEGVWLLAFKALLLQSNGEFDEAEQILKSSLTIEQIPSIVEANVLMELATLYRHRGQYNDSLDASMKALALVPEQTELAVTVYNNIGATHLQRGNNHLSGQYFEEALALAKQLSFIGGIGTSLLNLGGYYYHLGNNTKALEYFVASKEPLEQQGDIAGAAGVMMNIGVIYSQSGEPDLALKHYGRAYELRLKMGQKHLLAEVLVNMGLSYLRLGQAPEAHKTAQEIIALAESMSMIKEASMGYSIRAMAFCKQHKYEDALGAYSSSLQRAVEAEYIRGQIDALWEMADVYLRLNKPSHALKLLEEALPVAEQLGETKTISELHGVLAKTYADLQQYQRAWHHEQEKHAKWIEHEQHENAANLRKLKKQFEVAEAEKRANSAEQKKHELTEAYEKIRLREEQLLVLANDLELANSQLKAGNEQLAKLNQDKDEFLGIATHELKNPLNTIKLVTSLLAKEAQDIQNSVIEEYAVDINKTTTRMLKIVQGLLEVNRLELGKITATKADHDIVGLIKGLLHVYRDVANEKHIELMLETQHDSIVVNTDADLLIQVVDNLVSNAIKFSQPSSPVRIVLDQQLEHVRISVCDKGPGLTEEDKQQLFQKFAKLSARPTAGEHSTGLGLNIASRLVGVLGGSIVVDSEPAVGSEFRILLPLSTTQK